MVILDIASEADLSGLGGLIGVRRLDIEGFGLELGVEGVARVRDGGRIDLGVSSLGLGAESSDLDG